MAEWFHKTSMPYRVVDEVPPSKRPGKRLLEENIQPVSKKMNKEIDVSVPTHQNNFNQGMRVYTGPIGANRREVVKTDNKIPDTKINDVKEYTDYLQVKSGATIQLLPSASTVPNASGEMQNVAHAYRKREEGLNPSIIKGYLMRITLVVPKSGLVFPETNKSKIIDWILQKSGAQIEIIESCQELTFHIMGLDRQIKVAKLAICKIFQTSLDMPCSIAYVGERYYNAEEEKEERKNEMNFTSQEGIFD